MTQTPTRQPGNIWDRKYQDFSRAQHERSKAFAQRLTGEPIVLSTLAETLETELRQMVRDADKMAETRYAELAAERDALETALKVKLEEEQAATDAFTKLKEAVAKAGVKLP